MRARVADEPTPAAWRAGQLWTAFGTAAALVLAALRQLLAQARDQPVVVPVSAEVRTPVAAGEPPAELVIPRLAFEPAVGLAIPPHHNRAVDPDCVALAAILASGTAALAQPPLPPPAPPPQPGTPSAEAGVEVTISRYQGDELISSLPYVLSLTSDRGGRGSLRTGAEVPTLTMVQPATPDGAPVPGPFSYRSVGTQIDCIRREHPGGRGVDGSGLNRRLAAAQAADPTRTRTQAVERDLARVGKTIERLLTAYQEYLVSLDQLRERIPLLRLW